MSVTPFKERPEGFNEYLNHKGELIRIDPTKAHNLLALKEAAMSTNGDLVLVYDGEEGSGKSTQARQDGALLDRTLNETRIEFTPENAVKCHFRGLPEKWLPEEYMAGKYESKPWEVIILDESAKLDRKKTMSSASVEFTGFMTQSRQLHKIFIIVLPSIHMLDGYIAEHRCVALINCYKNEKQTMGFYKWYNRNQLSRSTGGLVGNQGIILNPEGNFFQRTGYKVLPGNLELVPLAKAGVESSIYLGAQLVSGRAKESYSTLQQNANKVKYDLLYGVLHPSVEGFSNVAAIGIGLGIGYSAIKSASVSQNGVVDISFSGESTQRGFKPNTLEISKITSEQAGIIKGSAGSDKIVGVYDTSSSSLVNGKTNIGFGGADSVSIRYSQVPAGKIARFFLGEEAVKTTIVSSQKASIPSLEITSESSTSVSRGLLKVEQGSLPFFNERYFSSPVRAENFYVGKLNNFFGKGDFSSFGFKSVTSNVDSLGEVTSVKIGGVLVGRGISSSKLMNVVDVSPFDVNTFSSEKGGFVFNSISKSPKTSTRSSGSVGRLSNANIKSGFDTGSGVGERGTSGGLLGNDFLDTGLVRNEPVPLPDSGIVDNIPVSLRSQSVGLLAANVFLNEPVNVLPSFVPRFITPPKVVSRNISNSVVRSSSLYSSRVNSFSLNKSVVQSLANTLSTPDYLSLNDVNSLSGVSSLSESSSIAASDSGFGGGTGFGVPFVPPPFIPPPPILLPPFNPPGGGGGKSYFSELGKPVRKGKNKYVASFTAKFLNIGGGKKGAKSGGYSGTELRGLLDGRVGRKGKKSASKRVSFKKPKKLKNLSFKPRGLKGLRL